MNNKKSKITTIILLLMTVGLMGAIFYIGYVLTATPEKSSTTVAPQKTKAQSSSYGKYISLNTLSPSPSIVEPSPITTTILTPTISQSFMPSPTEIILTYQSTSPTATPSSMISPTNKAVARTLPQTGFITNAIILFGVSALVIFISFIF